MKKNNNSIIKTTTLSAQVAITKTECGSSLIQGLGRGKCQMFNNGAFEFIQEKRLRGKPELKVDYGSLSFSTDGNDRVIFTVPAEMRAELPKVLRKGIKEIINYLKEEGYSL